MIKLNGFLSVLSVKKLKLGQTVYRSYQCERKIHETGSAGQKIQNTHFVNSWKKVDLFCLPSSPW